MLWYENTELSGEDPTFAGDVTLTRPPARTSLPEKVAAWWSGAGERIVNLEGPLAESCPPASNPYLFCNTLAAWTEIKDLATHWSVMNNHMLDLGVKGFSDTKALIEAGGKTPVTPKPVESDTMRVFALSAIINPVAEATEANLAASQVEVLKELKTPPQGKLSVVYVHGGGEFRALATDDESAVWRKFIDAGADAVIVNHGHLPGDVEIYEGKPIFRGLGNLIFDQTDRVSTSTIKLVRLKKDAGRTSFETLIVSSAQILDR